MIGSNPKIAFFGTPQIAVDVLHELKRSNLTPSLIVTNPDAPQGRKMIMTESPVSLWAHENDIPVHKFQSLRQGEAEEILKKSGCDLFIVAAYGKIIPDSILQIPKHQTLNVHPSLLPKLRGASPIRSAILENQNPTGVSIMILTSGIDEGPILAQETVTFQETEWPIRGEELDSLLAQKGGMLLASLIPKWIQGDISPTEQDHLKATFSTKITKEMGLIDLSADPFQNLLKIRAFDGWPGTYFFMEKNGARVRVKIIDAELSNGALKILRIVPEGKREMSYEDFVRGN